MGREKFALYGFELSHGDDWRVEFNPKGTRARGDVVFHTPKRNKFYVSWGRLEDAQGHFKSLDEHRDTSVKRLRGGSGVKDVSITESREEYVNGHRALLSHVLAKVTSGLMGRRLAEDEVWSLHLYCPESSRYYIIFSLVSDAGEYENSDVVFGDFAKSLVCHASRG